MRLLATLFLLAVVAVPAALPAQPPEAPPRSAEARPASEGSPEGVVGQWAGALDLGAVKLRLGLSVEAAADGTLSAVLDSIDQGAKVPVDSVTFEPPTFRLAIPSIGASYVATLDGDGAALEGTWSQGGRDLPLVLRRTDEPLALVRPQMPEPPFPYESRDVTFVNATAGVRLAGTLLLPAGEGPFPAVLFVTGSGPQDRDETLMGHKPFLVIADFLARRGIASLRYDDRGFGESEGDHMGSTVADFAADAEAGLSFLAAQEEIDRRAVGILGHSEGGLAAPRVALGSPEVDFLVLLAPPAEPLVGLLVRQTEALLRATGVEGDLVERALAAQREDLELVRDGSIPEGRLAELLRESYARRGADFTNQELARLGIDPAAVEQGIRQATSPWFRSLMREEPEKRLRRLEVPVLALFGSRDLQVDAEVNAEIARAALEGAGEGTEIRVVPGLNHLFQHAETGAPAEYGTIEETIAPEVLETIGQWIKARSPATSTPRSPRPETTATAMTSEALERLAEPL